MQTYTPPDQKPAYKAAKMLGTAQRQPAGSMQPRKLAF